MNKAKINEEDYINFVIATPMSYSCLEAGRVQAAGEGKAAHDAYTRLLHRLEPVIGFENFIPDLIKRSRMIHAAAAPPQKLKLHYRVQPPRH